MRNFAGCDDAAHFVTRSRPDMSRHYRQYRSLFKAGCAGYH